MSKSEEAQTEEEITEKYWGQWVAAKVVERDNGGQPVKFKIVSNSGDRYYLRNLVTDENDICIFYACKIPAVGSGLI